MSRLNDNENYCVYVHTSPSNKAYIGITSKDIKERWGFNGSHCKKNQHFWNAIQKYGWDNFKHEILFENLTKEKACKIEILLIALFNTQNPDFGYNISPGGELGFTGIILSEEHRRKISEAKKGKPGPKHTQETKMKMSQSKLGPLNPNYGKHIVWSDETKKKLSISKMGDSNPMFGKYGKDNPKSIPICQCDMEWNVVAIFWSTYEAEKITGIRAGNISSVCTQTPTSSGHIRHTAGGYRWRHATEEEIENAKSISI